MLYRWGYLGQNEEKKLKTVLVIREEKKSSFEERIIQLVKERNLMICFTKLPLPDLGKTNSLLFLKKNDGRIETCNDLAELFIHEL